MRNPIEIGCRKCGSKWFSYDMPDKYLHCLDKDCMKPAKYLYVKRSVINPGEIGNVFSENLEGIESFDTQAYFVDGNDLQFSKGTVISRTN